jgi:hypothetical protein
MQIKDKKRPEHERNALGLVGVDVMVKQKVARSRETEKNKIAPLDLML